MLQKCLRHNLTKKCIKGYMYQSCSLLWLNDLSFNAFRNTKQNRLHQIVKQHASWQTIVGKIPLVEKPTPNCAICSVLLTITISTPVQHRIKKAICWTILDRHTCVCVSHFLRIQKPVLGSIFIQNKKFGATINRRGSNFKKRTNFCPKLNNVY